MEIDRRTYIERTDALLLLSKGLQLLVKALNDNTDAINRNKNA